MELDTPLNKHTTLQCCYIKKALPLLLIHEISAPSFIIKSFPACRGKYVWICLHECPHHKTLQKHPDCAQISSHSTHITVQMLVHVHRQMHTHSLTCSTVIFTHGTTLTYTCKTHIYLHIYDGTTANAPRAKRHYA